MKQINETSHSKVHQCWILLERNGSAAIEITSVEAAVQFAAENEITLAAPAHQVGEFVILPVNPIHTALENFYTWSEVAPGDLPMREVWRPFLWLVGKDGGGDIWGANAQLKTIEVAPGVSVEDALKNHFRTVC